MSSKKSDRPSASEAARAPRRGRPARLSRRMVLESALELLRRAPAEELTMTGLARAMKIAPMSLYTHVEGRDDLLHGISTLVLEDLQLDLDPAAAWQDQLRMWIYAVHDHLIHYPQVVKLLGAGAHVPPAWLSIQARLNRILRAAGVDGERLADASRWLAQCTVGSVLLNIALHGPDASKREAVAGQASLDVLDERDRLEIESMLPHIEGREPDSLFRFSVERMIAAIEALPGIE